VATSLKDVALRAGVSVRTVSNVVNDAPYVAAATRARVQAALAELDYRPNLAARTLRQGRSGLLGLVVPEIDSPYFGELAGLLADAAERRGATLVVDQTRGDPDRERRLLSGPSGQLVDGLLLSPWALSPAEVAARPLGVPLVLLGERYDDATTTWASTASSPARTATGTCSPPPASGGRRGAAAAPREPDALQRVTGYRQALEEAGHASVPELEVAVQRLHRADGARAMQALLALDEPPDAVFCFTDELALGASASPGSAASGCPTTWRSSASTTSRTAAGPARRCPPSRPTRPCSPRSPSTGCSSGSGAAPGRRAAPPPPTRSSCASRARSGRRAHRCRRRRPLLRTTTSSGVTTISPSGPHV
jgi:DNA-binding LacI/PurR family transcriptional regulator